MKLNSKQLRDIPMIEAKEHQKGLKRNQLYLILENIYDTYNIGGLFRLADALAVEKIYLCGETETPPNHKIKKASVGTYKIVPWEYKETALEVIRKLKESQHPPAFGHPLHKGDLSIDLPSRREPACRQGRYPEGGRDVNIIAIEQSEKSVPYTSVHYHAPVALVVGNETYGVLPETLSAVDQIVEIPMWGINRSLNVIVSAGIVAYEVMRKGFMIEEKD